MPYPTAIVEISFASTPYTANPTWVDVTSYVREITTRRGRRDEFQDFGSGTATVVLDNRDRRFDPLNTASPYNGQLTPRRQIRIRAVTTSSPLVTQDVFRGYISGWPVSITDAGFDSTVTVECFDALGLLDTEEIPDDLADAYIRSLNPLHYWPLTDPADPFNPTAFSAQDYGSQPLPLVPVGPDLKFANSGGLAIGLPDTSLFMQANNNQAILGTTPTQGAALMSLNIWHDLYPTGQTDIGFFQFGAVIVPQYNATTDVLTILSSTYSGTVRTYTATIALDTSVPHMFTTNSNADGTLAAVYVDALPVTMTLASTTSGTAVTLDAMSIITGTQQQCSIWRGSHLTASQIETIYRLSRNILTETTAARFNRIIGYSSFPSALTSATASPVASVGAFTTGGPTIASELGVVSDSEGGNLYVNKAGVVVMTSRQQFATGTSLTSQATIGTTGISIGTSLDYQIDAENMRNQLAVGYSGDGSIELTDTASRDAYGIAGGSITTQLVSQADAQALAQFIIGFSSTPAVVVSPVEVNVSAVAADWDTVLSLELLDRITLTVQPRTGASFTQQQLLQSIEHRVIPGQWSTVLNGSVRYTNPFILDSSLLDGPDLLI